MKSRKLTGIEKKEHPLVGKGPCAECGKVRPRRDFMNVGICGSCLIAQLDSLPDWAKKDYEK